MNCSMEGEGVFIFTQDDLLPSYISAFQDMRGKGELIDFTITMQNRSFSGHRLVLAAGIPYFRKLFASSEGEIVAEEMDADVLEALINFAYSGKIEITDDNVRSLLSASKYLQLTLVHEACCEFLGKRLHLDNVVEIRTLAEKHHCSKLVGISDRYIQENFEALSKSEFFCKLQFAHLKEIISRDDLMVSSEENVFEAVIRWVKDSPGERKDLLPELLMYVRLSFLTPEYLIERVCSEKLVRTSTPCRVLVEEAKNYHQLPKKRSQFSSFTTLPLLYRSLFSSFTTRPRLYGSQSQHAACSNDSDHLICAVCDSTFERSVKLLDTENSKWITLSTTYSDQRIFHVVAFGGKIFTFLEEEIETFDLKTLQWKTVGNYCTALHDFRMTLHKNKIYFFGGNIRNLGRVLCFNPSENKWFKEEKMTKVCRYPGVASLGRYVYVMGGMNVHNTFADCERYDPEMKEWTAVAPMLYPRYLPECVGMNGMIYVCGGFDCGKNRSAEVYNPRTNRWNSICSKISYGNDFSLVACKSKLYALEKSSKDSGRAKMEIYDSEHDKWIPGVPLLDEEDSQIHLVTAAVP